MTVDYEITAGFDEPFFTGTGVPDPEDTNLPVSVDGRGFMVDLSDKLSIYHRMQRTSLDLTNTQQAGSSGDSAQVPPEVWRRSIESWDSGAGQTRVDRDSSDPNRFDSSYRVNVWEPWQFSLLHDTDGQFGSLAGGRGWLETLSGTQMVYVNGVDLYWWASIGTSPTHDTAPSAAVSVCSDGANLYVLQTNGDVRKWTAPGASSVFATIGSFVPGSAVIGFVSGMLVVGNGNILVNVTNGSPATIYTHPLAGFRWVGMCSSGRCAYLLGGQGDRYLVHKMALNANGTSFDPPSQATPLPDGEIGYAIASYLDFVLIGLNTGWRLAEAADSSGNLTYGRLITSDSPVRCFEGQNRFVWFGRDGIPGTRSSGLGRADLSNFPSELAPAWAPDLTTPEGPGHSGAVWAVCTFQGRRVFVATGDDVYAESLNLAPTGWLEQGQMAFGSTDAKMGLYVQSFHEPLTGGYTVDVAYDGSDTFATVGGATSGTTTGRLLLGESFHTVSVRYSLRRADSAPNLGPVVTRSEVRVLSVPGNATQVRLPLIIKSRFNYNGVAYERDVKDDRAALLSLCSTRRPVEVRVMSTTLTAYATDFLDWPEEPDPGESDYEGLFIIVMKEVV